MADTVLYEVDGPVATITLDDPDTRNALGNETLDGLIEAFELARDDEGVRVVVLTSSHEKVFSAGGNLDGFAAEVPLIHKHPGHAALSGPVPADRRAGQAHHLQGQRPRAGRGAGPGAGRAT